MDHRSSASRRRACGLKVLKAGSSRRKASDPNETPGSLRVLVDKDLRPAQAASWAFFFVGMFAAAAPAFAQLKKAPSPAGAWTFQTEKMAFGCELSGDMMVTPTTDKAFTCAFNAVWSCEQRPPRSVHTEQSCIATQAGGEISITSRIEKIVRVDPPQMAQLMQQRYAADHFNVTINSRADEMKGVFQSYGSAPVTFRRKLDLTS